MIKKRICANGIRTAVTQRQGEGPAIVFIHGNSLSQRLYEPLWAEPGLERFAMISYDLPGHGKSAFPSDPATDFTMAGYASHLQGLLEELGVVEVILFGFSMGGHIAFEAAGNNIGSIVKAVFTVGSPPLDSIGDFPAAFVTFPGTFSLFSENLSSDQIAVIADNITSDEGMRRLLSEDIKNTDPRARKFLGEGINKGMFNSEHDFLRSTAVPCRLAIGQHDKMLNSDYINGTRIKNLLGERLKILNGCEHLPDWTAAGECLNEFKMFLEEILV